MLPPCLTRIGTVVGGLVRGRQPPFLCMLHGVACAVGLGVSPSGTAWFLSMFAGIAMLAFVAFLGGMTSLVLAFAFPVLEG